MVKNGVRQGAKLSPSLFCVYLDSLLSQLRKLGLGCHVGGVFVGAFGYADDVTLLSPSRQGLQIMLSTCEKWANEYCMQFSTDVIPAKSKSKCLFFSRSMSADEIENLVLNSNKLPWVSSAKHLGNHLSTQINSCFFIPDMSSDLRCKRAILFDKVHQLMQQFGHVDPNLMVKLVSVYGTSLYGSSLWQLNSEDYLKLCRSWNTIIRIIWGLPYNTHTRFVESLSPLPHLQSALASRYVGFIQGLSATSNSVLDLLFKMCRNNVSTQTGHNIRELMESFNVFSFDQLLAHKSVIRSTRVYALEESESWKIGLINDIVQIQKGISSFTILEEAEMKAILEFVCTD